MNHRIPSLLVSALLLSVLALPWASHASDATSAAEQAALDVMEAFLTAFNARDEEAWADTLHFPHVRMASQTVTVYADREEFLAAMDMDAFAARFGWAYSTWDEMTIIQSSERKVHVQVIFSRFNANDELLASFDSLYVIELVDGRWGVRGRSSFAP